MPPVPRGTVRSRVAAGHAIRGTTGEGALPAYAVNRDRAVWGVVDGEAAIINVDTSFYYGLNATGTFIWTLLVENELSLDQIVARVSTRYRCPESEVREDVRRVLEQLREEQLILER
jgi:hypothetical protein